MPAPSSCSAAHSLAAARTSSLLSQRADRLVASVLETVLPQGLKVLPTLRTAGFCDESVQPCRQLSACTEVKRDARSEGSLMRCPCAADLLVQGEWFGICGMTAQQRTRVRSGGAQSRAKP